MQTAPPRSLSAHNCRRLLPLTAYANEYMLPGTSTPLSDNALKEERGPAILDRTFAQIDTRSPHYPQTLRLRYASVGMEIVSLYSRRSNSCLSGVIPSQACSHMRYKHVGWMTSVGALPHPVTAHLSMVSPRHGSCSAPLDSYACVSHAGISTETSAPALSGAFIDPFSGYQRRCTAASLRRAAQEAACTRHE